MNRRIVTLSLALLGTCWMAGCNTNRLFHCRSCNHGSHGVIASMEERRLLHHRILGAPQPVIGEKVLIATGCRSCIGKGTIYADAMPVPIGGIALPTVVAKREDMGGNSVPEIVVSQAEPKAIDKDLTDALNKFSNPSGDKAVALKSTTIHFGQSENFKQVTGQVQQWKKSWRLRYAPVEQEDAYGGCVVLDGVVNAKALRDGQFVRVRGSLVPPSNNEPAHYQVQHLEVLD